MRLEVHAACIREMINAYRIDQKKLREATTLKDQSTDGRIILKWILKNGVKM
jgi:hypothetical protein